MRCMRVRDLAGLAVLLAVLLPGIVLAAAADGQRLEDQPAEVQRIYRSLYDGRAEAVWEADHNREIGVELDPCDSPPSGRVVTWNGRTLAGEPAWIQQLFRRVHGEAAAAARWVWEHECVEPPSAPTPETPIIIKDPTPGASIETPADCTDGQRFDYYKQRCVTRVERTPTPRAESETRSDRPTPTPEPKPDPTVPMTEAQAEQRPGETKAQWLNRISVFDCNHWGSANRPRWLECIYPRYTIWHWHGEPIWTHRHASDHDEYQQ